jgi:hypothetical protein
LRGAGEQIPFQHHGSENAALDMPDDPADAVGAETGGEGGEADVGGVVWEASVQLPSVAEKDADDVEKGSDARRHGPFLWGVLGGWRRLVRGGVTNNIC